MAYHLTTKVRTTLLLFVHTKMTESELSETFARILEIEKSLPPRFKERILKAMQREAREYLHGHDDGDFDYTKNEVQVEAVIKAFPTALSHIKRGLLTIHSVCDGIHCSFNMRFVSLFAEEGEKAVGSRRQRQTWRTPPRSPWKRFQFSASAHLFGT